LENDDHIKCLLRKEGDFFEGVGNYPKEVMKFLLLVVLRERGR
jgi:hypothetical protein